MIGENIEILHAIPGRVRLRVGGLKRDPGSARGIQDRIADHPGVRQVEANPATGSVVIHFDPAAGPPGAFLRQIVPEHVASEWEAGPARALNGSSLGFASAGRIAGLFRQVDRRVEATTGGLDLKVLLPVVLFIFGMRALLAPKKKLALPTWYDFLWFAFGTFVALNRPAIEERADQPGRSSPRINPTPDGD